MGTEIGEFAEKTFLFEAACNPDPVLRLTGVNRALEGLAIDVFTTMKEFGDLAGDPVLEFCEDWMLADEVTHVKMGSDWLRRLTENDPERREQRARVPARRRQAVLARRASAARTRTVPIKLARRFRELAGFDDDEIDEIAELSRRGARRGRGSAARGGSAGRQAVRMTRHGHARDLHDGRVRRGRDHGRGREAGRPRSACRRIVDIRIEVDETTPLGRATVASYDDPDRDHGRERRVRGPEAPAPGVELRRVRRPRPAAVPDPRPAHARLRRSARR